MLEPKWLKVVPFPYSIACGGTVTSWLVRLTPDRAVLARALAGNIVLCSWASQFILTLSLSTQVYKRYWRT